MDRRHFMGVGGASAALFGIAAAEASQPISPAIGKTVLDFGVEADAWADQSAAMQKAIDQLTASGQPIIIPAGRYRVSKLQLSTRASVLGLPGLTVLSSAAGAFVFESSKAQDLNIRGITFSGMALFARDCRNLTLSDCQILSSPGDGFICSGSGLFIAGNRVASCARSGIWVEGDGMVTNNLVSGEGEFGLRIGTRARLGAITVLNNRIEGTAAGIGVSNAPDGYALISMNFIVGAKMGGVRALNDDKLIGRDLTQGGSEAFRNLTVFANVSV